MGDGEIADDGNARSRFLPPEDRLWRHPSEITPNADKSRPSAHFTHIVSAMGGAIVVAAIWLMFGGSTKVMLATERVALAPVESVASIARPSTAEVRHVNGTTVIAVAMAIRDDGYLITSGRAIGDAETVIIVTSSGTTQKATVIGTDLTTDISVLRVDDPMIPAVVSDGSSPVSGETLALVNPRGDAENRVVMMSAATSATSDGTLLIGVIALESYIGDIFPGSPAVDATGAVVGMIAATAANAPMAVVPIKLVRSVAHSLITRGWVDHPKAGVTARDLSPADDADEPEGVLVISVEANGPAADSGMLVGDVVVQVGDTSVSSMAGMVAELMTHRPGEILDFLVLRDGHEVVCNVQLEASATADR